MRKVLILSGFPPEGGGGGGVIIRSLLNEISEEKIFWYSLVKDKTIKKWWRPNILRSFPFISIPGLSYKPIFYINKYAFSYIFLIFSILKIRKVKKQWEPNFIWIIVDKELIYEMYILVLALKLPWHISVHDDPGISKLLSGKKISTKDQMYFKYLMQNAKSIDCISNNMSNYYKNMYNVDSIVLTRGVSPEKTVSKSKRKLFENNQINIVMGGWGDCPLPWPKCVIEALVILEKKTQMKVQFFAFDPIFKEVNNSSIIYCPRMQNDEYEIFLDKMDIGYAPDPLIDKFALFAKTSMSTKIVTYISACIPSLYHGPKDSSINEIFSRYQAGEIMDSNNPIEIANAFYKLIENSSTYRENCIQLACNDFNENLLQLRLSELVFGEVN